MVKFHSRKPLIFSDVFYNGVQGSNSVLEKKKILIIKLGSQAKFPILQKWIKLPLAFYFAPIKYELHDKLYRIDWETKYTHSS